MKRNWLFILVVVAGCSSSGKVSTEAKARERLNTLDQESQTQINSLLTMIDEQARFINSGEIHYIPYEFRIPLSFNKKKEIHRIDSTVSFIKRKKYYQCIGENATQELVFNVLALSYTSKIKFCPYE